MVSRSDFDWKLVSYFPIQLNLHGVAWMFNPETGEWQRGDQLSEEDSPEINQRREELYNLKVKNDILLDMITAKDLDMQEAEKIVGELEEMVSNK